MGFGREAGGLLGSPGDAPAMGIAELEAGRVPEELASCCQDGDGLGEHCLLLVLQQQKAPATTGEAHPRAARHKGLSPRVPREQGLWSGLQKGRRKVR